MSDIKKKLDAKQAELIRNADDRGRGGSTLLAPLDLEQQIDKIYGWMTSPNLVTHGTSGKQIRVPRLGLLSLVLSKTPIRVYGHPALKRVAKTAFTDGVTIFLCEDLLDKLNDDQRKNPTTYGAVWVIMHEVMHVLRNHAIRSAMKKFPPDVANQAADLLINTQLDEGFPDRPPCPSIRNFALGFKDGDKERWMHLPESVIAMQLMADRGLNKKRKQENQGGDQQQPQQGGGPGQPQQGGGGGQPDPQGQGGKGGQQGKGKGGKEEQDESDPLSNLDDNPGGQGQQDPSQGGGSGQPQQGGGRGKGQPGQGGQSGDEQGMGGDEGEGEEEDSELSGEFGADDDQHFIDPADLAAILEENGMGAVRERLGLPEAGDEKGFEKYKEKASMNTQEAIQDAESQMYRAGGSFPGQHIVTSAVEMVKGFTNPKVTWRLPLQDIVLSSGDRTTTIMDEPHDVYYIPGIEGFLGIRPYLPSIAPAKSNDAVIFLIDSSGSMSHEALVAQVTEAVELQTAATNRGDSAARVFIWSADTMLRGEPQEINADNVEEFLRHGLELRGRGGTSIETCVNQALSSPIIKDMNIRALVYGSDLLDSPVPRPDILENHPELKVLFLADPHVAPETLHRFAKGTDWADVYVIDDGVTIDLEEVNNGKQVVSPAARPGGRSKKPGMR